VGDDVEPGVSALVAVMEQDDGADTGQGAEGDGVLGCRVPVGGGALVTTNLVAVFPARAPARTPTAVLLRAK
jgi:hypothetical protein